MAKAKKGDLVKVHYTGRLEDGTVFGSSGEDEPMQFKIGDGSLIPGFEKAIVGMNPGESKTVNVPSDEAFGPHREDLVLIVDRNEFPTGIDPQVGEQLELKRDEHIFIVTVTNISTETVTLDANHPLAGEDLIFDIHLEEID
ncbi:MAG: peptidylprolyl isomerase [Candidatus Latescibacteria bacterium]|nr:peptidylprolyl isomerase [Candidatus Latescibacterota bacterium]NIO57347.1 peptidylprolyl isomerase [Candidatus Latescibacterota bacterium]